MKGWEKNALEYEKGERADICPFCGKRSVKIEEHISGNRKSLSFTCKACGKWEHYDGFVRED